jgi:hypothetical protein
MNLGEVIFKNFFELLLNRILKHIGADFKRRRVSRMTPEQLEKWRTKEFAKIHEEVMLATVFKSDKKLRELGIKRADLIRTYEVILRNNLGVRMSRYCLEGMDIRGLDLRRVQGLDQQQIDRAVGDATTQLPDYLHVPRTWSGHK